MASIILSDFISDDVVCSGSSVSVSVEQLSAIVVIYLAYSIAASRISMATINCDSSSFIFFLLLTFCLELFVMAVSLSDASVEVPIAGLYSVL